MKKNKKTPFKGRILNDSSAQSYTTEENIIFPAGATISGNYSTPGFIKAEGDLFLSGHTSLSAEENVELNNVIPVTETPPNFEAISRSKHCSVKAGQLGSDIAPLQGTNLEGPTVTVDSIFSKGSVFFVCNWYTADEYYWGTAGIGTIESESSVSIEALNCIYGKSIKAADVISLESTNIDIEGDITADVVEINGEIVYSSNSKKNLDHEKITNKEQEKLFHALLLIFLCSAIFRR